MEHQIPFTAADVASALRVLRACAEDRARLAELSEDERRALLHAAGRLAHPERTDLRRLAKALRRKDRRERRAHDSAIVEATAMRAARRAPVFVPLLSPPPPSDRPPPTLLEKPRSCYVCKAEYRQVHFFYDSLCPPCGDLNWAKRSQTARLDGRVALVTGARIKIGYQTALMLLRAGARVIATTRFPNDAARRYASEPDYASWADRLQIHGLDLRHAPSVELFTQWLDGRLDRLDILINNAAQTVRRPPAFYEHLLAGEDPSVRRQLGPASVHDLAPIDEVFPMGRYDADLQQVDLRRTNSWRLQAAEVPTIELLEVHLVNAIAPFLLAARLKPLMMRDRTDEKHVVNVSAMEAQFSRKKKTDKHPHTNMAKAALNMLTRTSAADWAEHGIWMNSVDTGWITDEDPFHHVVRKQREHDFHPPLDVVDGAARVCDPIFTGLLTGEHPWGKFFKDYQPTGW